MTNNILDKTFDFLEKRNKHFKKIRTIGKYTIFSVIATLTDLLFLYVFTEFIGLFYLVSVKLSYFIGMIVAFFGNKQYTFKKTNKRSYHQFIDFFIISVIDLCMNVILIKLLTEYLGVWYILSKIITVIIIFFGKYLLHKKIAFKN
ncbi:GtrA family protein [archaeon]|nr:GtrA family protein [archaeon]NCP79107.1 GtrA family protein [archaeon]NCP98572.1 GtrA family protein [archaeon]NCQ06874.1 GtrA family protein [archaeon]NCQ50670.1 GtrA family protein [archaeon]